MKSSIAMNVLRLGLLLVFIGLFTPISCNSNGYQIAQGILGNANQAGHAQFLSGVDNIYGYVLFGVFALALLGLVITFLYKNKNSFNYGLLSLAASFVLILIIMNKLKIHFNSKEMDFYFYVGMIPFKAELLFGWYSMIVGYIVGVLAFILKIFKITS
jgi:hypothetical protein